jgi:putative SOS response-associated peptidase YedK
VQVEGAEYTVPESGACRTAPNHRIVRRMEAMCNRLCLWTDISAIANSFDALGEMPEQRIEPHWNLAAGRVLPVVRYDQPRMRRILEIMRWGLIPAHAKETKVVYSNLDFGRQFLEEVGISGAPLPWRRCLVPADCFFEWRRSDGQPFAVVLASRELMALAALWSRWLSSKGECVDSFAILTTGPNQLLASICDRMPVIVPPSFWDYWLGPDAVDARIVAQLCRPTPSDSISTWPVDRRVNDRKLDDARLLEANRCAPS